MAEKEVFLTPEGLAKLETELEHLRTVGRQEVANKIAQAKQLSGAAIDSEFDDAKKEQAFVEGRILTLENMIKRAKVIGSATSTSGRVEIGSKVTVRDQEGKEEHYTIVGSAEANPRQGKISNESPVGRALLGKRVGEETEVNAPAGVRKLTVINIE
jgi:transcription elongation factor GreA